MAAMRRNPERWYLTKEQLDSSPSRRDGIDCKKELSYRRQASQFIQEMGRRLSLKHLCTNTAITYMHRFYVIHSLKQFHRNEMAAASLFLAAKVEEQPQELERFVRVMYALLHKKTRSLDPKCDTYTTLARELIENEQILLQTLANKELAKTSYILASYSLSLTTMCLQYKPTVVACVCIYLACKLANYEIARSSEDKDWWEYVDPSVTKGRLEGVFATGNLGMFSRSEKESLADNVGCIVFTELVLEFLQNLDRCPCHLKRKMQAQMRGIVIAPSSSRSNVSDSSLEPPAKRVCRDDDPATVALCVQADSSTASAGNGMTSRQQVQARLPSSWTLHARKPGDAMKTAQQHTGSTHDDLHNRNHGSRKSTEESNEHNAATRLERGDLLKEQKNQHHPQPKHQQHQHSHSKPVQSSDMKSNPLHDQLVGKYSDKVLSEHSQKGPSRTNGRLTLSLPATNNSSHPVVNSSGTKPNPMAYRDLQSVNKEQQVEAGVSGKFNQIEQELESHITKTQQDFQTRLTAQLELQHFQVHRPAQGNQLRPLLPLLPAYSRTMLKLQEASRAPPPPTNELLYPPLSELPPLPPEPAPALPPLLPPLPPPPGRANIIL